MWVKVENCSPVRTQSAQSGTWGFRKGPSLLPGLCPSHSCFEGEATFLQLSLRCPSAGHRLRLLLLRFPWGVHFNSMQLLAVSLLPSRRTVPLMRYNNMKNISNVIFFSCFTVFSQIRFIQNFPKTVGKKTLANSPFYRCELSYQAFERKRGSSWLCFDKNLLAFQM